MTAASTIVIMRQVLRTALGSSAARHGCRRQCHLTRRKSLLAKGCTKFVPPVKVVSSEPLSNLQLRASRAAPVHNVGRT